MSDVGVVLRVPQDLHGQLKQACAKHDRSMQKVVIALIESWLANGAPDPGSFGYEWAEARPHSGEDTQARQAIVDLGAELKRVEARLSLLESTSKGDQKPDFEAFYKQLRNEAKSS